MLCAACFDRQEEQPRANWPHQTRAIEEFVQAVRAGERAICVTGPTGSGKTAVMAALAKIATEHRSPVALFTNRRLLTNQASATMASGGIDHGVMAAGYDAKLLSNVQVCSFQTIDARVYGSGKWRLPRAKLVLVDEAHSNKADVAAAVIKHYLDAGAVVAGFTATPIGIGHLYKKLIVAGTKKECRSIGALVPCYVNAPNEPDLKGVRKRKVGEDAAGKAIMQTIVHADPFKYWKQLNPDAKPTVLWAPGVPESKWFVGEWRKLGVTAEHIDANTPDDERQRIFDDSREGRCKVICSQGVLREGVDLPWLYHGILCQACINLSTYLQIVGRLLRAYPGKDRCWLQDHAGAFHRHCSPNADIDWKLTDTDQEIAAERKRKLESGDEREPIRCPQCGGIRMTGPKCPHCGHEHVRSSRAIIMEDGTLVRKVGQVRKKKRQVSPDERLWVQCLYAASRSKSGPNKGPRTVSQAKSDFRRRSGHDLPGDVKFHPSNNSLAVPVTEVYPWLIKSREAA